MTEFKNFNNVIDLVNWIESLKRYTKNPTLERMYFFNSLYDNPIESLKFIHVAGTNGKGSIISVLKSVLIENGKNVGAFISPHVTIFNERISYNDLAIANEDLLDISNYILSKYSSIVEIYEQPTYFEFITMVAFIYFKRKNVDIVLLEAGIGGTNDSTNIIQPIISIIGQVDYDHCEILGNTIEKITLDKVGIIKTNSYAICLADERINNIFINKAKEVDTKIFLVNKEDINLIEVDQYKTIFEYKNQIYKCNLLGEHQSINISLVIKAIEILNKYFGYNITDCNVKKGLMNIKHLGRIQVLNYNPLIILDGAHNINGINSLVRFINSIKGNKKVNYIVSISKGKDILQILNKICSNCDYLSLTEYDEFKSIKTQVLLEIIKNNSLINMNMVHQITSFEDVYNTDLDSDKIYVYCGSLYFIRKILNKLKLQ